MNSKLDLVVVIPESEEGRRSFDKLVKAAEDCFSQQGYRNTTIKDIARSAGLSVGAFYIYFRSKYQLYVYIMQSFARRLQGYLDSRAGKITGDTVDVQVGYIMEFIRFALYEGGIYYARIQPRNHVLPVIMSHFADRLGSIPFIIHDAGRNLAGVWDTREWIIVSAEGMNLPHLHEDEMKWQRLWKRFYDKVAVEGRINPKLRRQMMPKRYWDNLCEMNLLSEESRSF